MNKPPFARYEAFVAAFAAINARLGKKEYLVNYFISAHPGARLEDACACAEELLARGLRPEQVQDFLPLPMTAAACMYHTGKDPFTGKPVHVVKKDTDRAMQRALLQSQNPANASLIAKALRILGQTHLKDRFRARKEYHDHG